MEVQHSLPLRCSVRAPLKVLPLPMVAVRPGPTMAPPMAPPMAPLMAPPAMPGSSSTMIWEAAESMGVVARLFWLEKEYMLATPLAVEDVCMRYTGPVADERERERENGQYTSADLNRYNILCD